jgi:hypothetical protein
MEHVSDIWHVHTAFMYTSRYLDLVYSLAQICTEEVRLSQPLLAGSHNQLVKECADLERIRRSYQPEAVKILRARS